MAIIKALVTCMNDLLSILALQNNTLKQNASVVARVASSANQQEHKNTQRGSGSITIWVKISNQGSFYVRREVLPLGGKKLL